MKQIDVVFVHPNASNEVYQNLSESYSAIENPIWAAMLSKAVRNKGYKVELLDLEANRQNEHQATVELLALEPKLIAIVVYGQQPSASTQNMIGASKLIESLKKTEIRSKIVLIGLHPSATARNTLQEEKCDFVCQGEGLHTILDLLKVTDFNDHSQLDKVRGLWYRKSIFTKFNPHADVIEQQELSNELPGMAWDLLDMKKYRTANWHALSNNNERMPFASLYTSLGCPYSCEFCCINAPFGNNNLENSYGKPSFRYWNTDFIIKEFEQIANFGIRNVKIADEMFVLYPQHYADLCQKIIDRKLDFNIWAYARVNTVKEGQLDLMKRAGINWLALGIESGDLNVRKNVIKGAFKEVDIVQTVRKIQNAGINVIGNFIFGLPEDNLETMQTTLDLATELNCEFANFYSAMAYPGSALYLKAIENNWELPKAYSGYSQHSYDTTPLKTNHISAAEVLKFRDEAFLKYFKNENYLNMVKNKFGDQAHRGIVDMTGHTLKRQLLGD